MSQEHPDIDDLLRLVDTPGSLPGSFEEDLRAELLADLALGPLTDEAGERSDDSDVVLLQPETSAETALRDRGRWLAAAAAILVVVVALAVAGVRDRGGTVAELPAPTPTPLPALEDPTAGCGLFVDATPNRDDLEELVGSGDQNAIEELDRVLEAIDDLRADAASSGADQADLDTLDLARSRFVQTRLLLETGDTAAAAESLTGANAELGRLDDARLGACRLY